MIPPEILNKRANGDDSDTSIEEIEAEVVNDTQNINIEDDGVNVQEVMDEGVDDDSTPEDDMAENEVNESIPRGHKNHTAENSTREIEESENVDNINILQVITSRLLNGHRSKKWNDLELTPEMLFTDILNNAPNIQKLIVKELDMISEVYHEYTGHSMPFKKCDNKGTKVNIISQTFGDKSTVVPTRTKLKSPITLKSIVKKFVMKPSYPKDVIVAAAAKIHYIKTIDYWESKFTVPLEEYIVNSGEIYHSYCYPEHSEERDQIECRLLDLTHLLTNMRCHCTKKDMGNSLSSVFLKVSKSDNDILPRSIISPMLDKQSAVIAMKFFSEEVQEKMVELEEMKEYLENQKPPEDRKKVVKTSYFVKCTRE